VAEAGVLEAPKEVMVAMEEEVAVVSFSCAGDAFRPWAWNVCCSDVRIETFAAAVACSLSSCCPSTSFGLVEATAVALVAVFAVAATTAVVDDAFVAVAFEPSFVDLNCFVSSKIQHASYAVVDGCSPYVAVVAAPLSL